MKVFVCLSLVIIGVGVCVSLAAPEPAIVPRPDEWTVRVGFAHPQQMVLRREGVEGPEYFWYMVLTVTNRLRSDVDFYPKCELMTDTFRIIPAGKAVTPTVFEQIKRRHQSRYPFLEPLDKVDNKILQGEDNTEDIAIVWPDFDAKAKNIRIFVTGLSNETVTVDHPVARDETGKPLKVFLRKTFELSYAFRGDPALRADTSLVYKGKRWIMR